jgi:hypothetical protein
MAVNVSVFDLVNYPSNPKTVTVDLTELVPYGNSGEDTWVISAVTTATASGGASIQRLYLSDIKFGWAKSSGLQSGPYSITDSQKHLKIAIDEDIADAVEIALDTNILGLGGDAVASDIQSKLSNAASAGGAKAGNLSYLNAVCTYTNGTFMIISGTASNLYSGSTRSSVAVADGTTTTGLAAELGFDIPFTSENIVSTQVKQTSLAADYSSGTSITVAGTGIVSEGDCVGITDGTNTEYRGVESSLGTAVTLSSGMDNSYLTGSLVQVLELQDPSGEPPPAYANIDDVLKFAIASIVNQIDFSS